MRPAITLICFALILSQVVGCVPLIAGAITHNALENNNNRKEWVEKHRHQERMRELELQEKLINRQYPQVYTTDGTDGGAIVRETPF